jgi:hypothetical protein
VKAPPARDGHAFMTFRKSRIERRRIHTSFEWVGCKTQKPAEEKGGTCLKRSQEFQVGSDREIPKTYRAGTQLLKGKFIKFAPVAHRRAIPPGPPARNTTRPRFRERPQTAALRGLTGICAYSGAERDEPHPHHDQLQ